MSDWNLVRLQLSVELLSSQELASRRVRERQTRSIFVKAAAESSKNVLEAFTEILGHERVDNSFKKISS